MPAASWTSSWAEAAARRDSFRQAALRKGGSRLGRRARTHPSRRTISEMRGREARHHHRKALWFSRRSERVPREQKGGQESAVVKCSPRKTRLPAEGSGRRPKPQRDTRGITV